MCGEARYEDFAYPHPGLFSATMFLPPAVHSGSNSDRDSPNPTKIAQIPTNMAQDRTTRICVGMTVK